MLDRKQWDIVNVYSLASTFVANLPATFSVCFEMSTNPWIIVYESAVEASQF